MSQNKISPEPSSTREEILRVAGKVREEMKFEDFDDLVVEVARRTGFSETIVKTILMKGMR